MITADDLNRFEKGFAQTSSSLQKLGFVTCPYSLEKKRQDAIAAILTKSEKNKLTIAAWYGSWFERGARNRFWFGFEGSREQISTLAQVSVNRRLVSPGANECKEADLVSIALAEKNNGVVCEFDIKQRYYFGVYILSSDTEISNDIVDRIPRLLNDIVEETKVEEISNDNSVSVTQRKALIDARVGQGLFRRKLEEVWGKKCAVTGCPIGAMLRASHIKPWKYANNEERLDPDNGLLLSANLDALFDKGLIGFRDDGSIISGTAIPLQYRRILFSENQALTHRPSDKQREFLRLHRIRFALSD